MVGSGESFLGRAFAVRSDGAALASAIGLLARCDLHAAGLSSEGRSAPPRSQSRVVYAPGPTSSLERSQSSGHSVSAYSAQRFRPPRRVTTSSPAASSSCRAAWRVSLLVQPRGAIVLRAQLRSPLPRAPGPSWAHMSMNILTAIGDSLAQAVDCRKASDMANHGPRTGEAPRLAFFTRPSAPASAPAASVRPSPTPRPPWRRQAPVLAGAALHAISPAPASSPQAWPRPRPRT